MKAVLISIKPKYCELIVSGQKKIEVRKSELKIKPPFKCYIYQTNHKWIYKFLRSVGFKTLPEKLENARGKVIGEFICDRIEEFESEFFDDDTVMNGIYRVVEDEDYPGVRIITRIASNEEDSENFWICTLSCLSFDEIKKYIGWDKREKTFYGWDISNLKIYDKPKELFEFTTTCSKFKNKVKCGNSCEELSKTCIVGAHGGIKRITRPPQSWCYIEENNSVNI